MLRFLARLQPYAILIVRLVVGFSMVYNSWEKVYPVGGMIPAYRHHALLGSLQHFNEFVATLGLPRWLGYVSTVTEFVGGISLLVGLLSRFWALMICGNMLVALITVNRHHGIAGSQYSMALIAMAFLLITTGGGVLSLDRRLGIA